MTARIKHSLSLVFLALFLTTRMGGLHVLTHTDSDLNDDCPICHVLTADQQTAVVVLESEDFVPVTFYPVLQKQVLTSGVIIFQGDLHSYHLFSRPPPAA